MNSLSVLGAVVFFSAAHQAGATVTFIGIANGSAAPVLNSSFGTMELALNLGQTVGGTTVRDGITFTNNSVTGTTSVTYGSASGITAGAFASAGVTINNANLGGDSLYNTESYTSGNAPMTLTLTGLDAAKTYLVQVMHADPRALTYNAGAVTATDSLSNVANSTLTFGPGGTGNQFALVSIQVSGSTSLNYFMPTAGRGPSFAGVTVQSIPEPGCAAVLGLTGLMTLSRRRRR